MKLWFAVSAGVKYSAHLFSPLSFFLIVGDLLVAVNRKYLTFTSGRSNGRLLSGGKGQRDLKAFAGGDGESIVRAEGELDALVDVQDTDMAVVFGICKFFV